MSGGFDRNMIAEFAVLLAACVGSWVLFVQPKVDELGELGQLIAEAKQNPVLMDRSRIQKMAGMMNEIRSRVKYVGTQNGFARDSSQMYGIITRLAKSHGVTVDRLDPGSSARTADPDAPVRVVAFNMGVQGKYRQVASFLDAVAELDGFVRPVSLTLTPKGEQGSALVDARFACEALSFRMPDVLVSLAGENDADQ